MFSEGQIRDVLPLKPKIKLDILRSIGSYGEGPEECSSLYLPPAEREQELWVMSPRSLNKLGD